MTTEAGSKTYDILFFCGASVAGNKLVPEQCEGIVDDYKFIFEATRNWQPDILLVNHPFYFDMHKRRKKQIAGDPLAFVDKGAFSLLHVQLERDFHIQLQKISNFDR
jgi:metallo-beta-lactamase class B